MQYQRILTAVLTLTGWTLSCFAQTTTAATNTRTMQFPPVGLASTETAHLNLTNTAANSSTGTAASCTGTVTFLNAAGTAIGSASSFTLSAGQTSSASLAFSSAGLSGIRGVIRAQVQLTLPTASSTTATPPCQLLTSFETFDTNSGVTHVLLDGGSQSFGGLGGPRP